MAAASSSSTPRAAPEITWEEAEEETARAMLALAVRDAGPYADLLFLDHKFIDYVEAHYPAFYEEYHTKDRLRYATVHGWSRLYVSARLCSHRLRGWDSNKELHFILGCKGIAYERYLLDRMTEVELAHVVATPHPWCSDTGNHECKIAQRELDLRARGDFERSSLGQLALPSVLVQLIGQFHSPAITPSKPVRLRPPSYTARVEAIRKEMQLADPAPGQTRAVSQMLALEEGSRKKHRLA